MNVQEMLELSRAIATSTLERTWQVKFRGKSKSGAEVASHVTVEGLERDAALAHAKKLLAHQGWTLLDEPTIETHPMVTG